MYEYQCKNCGYASNTTLVFEKKEEVAGLINSSSWACPECNNLQEPSKIKIIKYRCSKCGYIGDSLDDFNKQSGKGAITTFATQLHCPECNNEGKPTLLEGNSVEQGISKINKQDSINAQITNLPVFHKFMSYNEIKELPNILWDDEQLETIASGHYKSGYGIIVATNKRIIFIDKGMVYGLRVEDFPYDKITSIEYKIGLFRGEITIYASGNKAKINKVPKELTKEFSDYVRARITPVSENQQSDKVETNKSQEKVNTEDYISQLERLAELKEKGILTEEEFNEQKKKILSN